MAGTEETEGVVGDGFWFGVLVGVGSGGEGVRGCRGVGEGFTGAGGDRTKP